MNNLYIYQLVLKILYNSVLYLKRLNIYVLFFREIINTFVNNIEICL